MHIHTILYAYFQAIIQVFSQMADAQMDAFEDEIVCTYIPLQKSPNFLYGYGGFKFKHLEISPYSGQFCLSVSVSVSVAPPRQLLTQILKK